MLADVGIWGRSVDRLAQENTIRLETVKAEGLTQMQDYLRHAKLQAMNDLRAWLIVFVGPKASVVMAVTV